MLRLQWTITNISISISERSAGNNDPITHRARSYGCLFGGQVRGSCGDVTNNSRKIRNASIVNCSCEITAAINISHELRLVKQPVRGADMMNGRRSLDEDGSTLQLICEFCVLSLSRLNLSEKSFQSLLPVRCWNWRQRGGLIIIAAPRNETCSQPDASVLVFITVM